MTTTTKKQISRVSIAVAIVLFVVAIVAMLMSELRPKWIETVLTIAALLTVVGIVLSLAAKKGK